MLKDYIPQIDNNDNLIIAVGDSFTQGIGAYPDHVWKNHEGNPHFNIVGELYRDYQMENNWATQLTKHHLPKYKVVNLAVNGVGNRAAAKEIYLQNIPKTSGTVIVFFMLSGLQRFDFLKQEYNGSDHMRWLTIWPIPNLHKGDPVEKVEQWYAYNGHSDKSSIIETLLSIAEVQNFCKANGYLFVFANAFDELFNIDRMKTLLGNDANLLQMLEWKNFIPTNFTLQFLEKEANSATLWEFTSQLKLPSKYITPCSHWTIEGHRIVADQIFKFLKENYELDI